MMYVCMLLRSIVQHWTMFNKSSSISVEVDTLPNHPLSPGGLRQETRGYRCPPGRLPSKVPGSSILGFSLYRLAEIDKTYGNLMNLQISHESG